MNFLGLMTISYPVTYAIKPLATKTAKLLTDGLFPVWAGVEPVAVDQFLPESSAHRPQTQARMVYDAQGLHGQFLVKDRYVRCVRTGYGSEVWKDSCVEFFVEPKPGRGYFNFEFNCGGSFLVNHIKDPTRTSDGFKDYVRIPERVAQSVRVLPSLRAVIEPEMTEATTWTLEYFIPFALLENYVGPVSVAAGQIWRGNFYKCAEDNSHPHWAAWSPVDEFNFHQPHLFGELRFV